ncbi:hypothetical protein A7U60_g3073 [Sanghuangporus baumii]|uniref:DUF6534 domain-containing protein n=1 Tax=Sanghuangporus baumii TaxID=108892 RepID=A0A9Q5I120_SANBA|nr:hypothetical protein A7U60_g3073 [Sanghuangporus baumii]
MYRPEFKKTERIITRLVAFTIGTGLITSVVAFVAFVSAIVLPHALVYPFMDFCMSKLYYNCMLASLNARSSLREKMDRTSEMLSFHLVDMTTVGSEEQAVPQSTLQPMPRIQCWLQFATELYYENPVMYMMPPKADSGTHTNIIL